jgi:hypothetical protein
MLKNQHEVKNSTLTLRVEGFAGMQRWPSMTTAA